MFNKTISVIVILLTLTLSSVIIGSVIGVAVKGSEANPEYRAKMFDLLTYIAGLISGWLMSQSKDTNKNSTVEGGPK